MQTRSKRKANLSTVDGCCLPVHKKVRVDKTDNEQHDDLKIAVAPLQANGDVQMSIETEGKNAKDHKDASASEHATDKANNETNAKDAKWDTYQVCFECSMGDGRRSKYVDIRPQHTWQQVRAMVAKAIDVPQFASGTWELVRLQKDSGGDEPVGMLLQGRTITIHFRYLEFNTGRHIESLTAMSQSGARIDLSEHRNVIVSNRSGYYYQPIAGGFTDPKDTRGFDVRIECERGWHLTREGIVVSRIMSKERGDSNFDESGADHKREIVANGTELPLAKELVPGIYEISINHDEKAYCDTDPDVRLSRTVTFAVQDSTQKMDDANHWQLCGFCYHKVRLSPQQAWHSECFGSSWRPCRECSDNASGLLASKSHIALVCSKCPTLVHLDCARKHVEKSTDSIGMLVNEYGRDDIPHRPARQPLKCPNCSSSL